MSTNPPDSFADIDPTLLDTVIGGRRAASSSSRGDRIMDALNSLENSIRDLGRNQQAQPDAMSQMLPILMMSMLNQPAPAAAAPQPTVIYQGGRGKKGW